MCSVTLIKYQNVLFGTSNVPLLFDLIPPFADPKAPLTVRENMPHELLRPYFKVYTGMSPH